jgi:cytochrome c oxidase assembly factor CtaG
VFYHGAGGTPGGYCRDVFVLGPVLAVLYGAGVRRLGRRGRVWRVRRSLAFGAGAVTVAASGVIPETSFVGHMTGHVLLGMVAPILLALGRPATLALQSTGRPARRRLLRVLHSGPARTLAHPVVGFGLFGATLVALYLSPLFPLSLRNPAVHAAVHLHVLAAGCLFLWPLVGADPLPRPLPYGARILAVLAAVPFHAFLGVALLSTRQPLAPEVYPSLSDQHAAAGLLWGSGELFTLVTAAVVLRAWMDADERHAMRFDERPGLPDTASGYSRNS